MATIPQIAAYIRQHKDRYPLAALKAQLLKQGISEADIEQGIQLANAPAAAPASPPVPAPVQPAPQPQVRPAPAQPAPAQSAAAPATPPGAAPVVAAASAPPVGRTYVLVVDDDQLIRDMMVNKLEGAGYRVTCAEDAAQSVIQAEGMRLALIISDIEMPGFGTGVDALKKLRASSYIRKNLPVIFVTGMPPAEARKIVPKTDPYVRLLHKPVDWKLLRQYIKELTGIDKSLD
ncbi:MAG: response regulator [Elusimicrobiota bacterium]|jgi:CheY-like chemotaxis protein